MRLHTHRLGWLLSVALIPFACLAQDTIEWDGMGADNDWETVDNWDHFVPGALPSGSENEIAAISNGDTAVVSTILANISSPDSAPGQLAVSGGSTLQVIGSGAFSTQTNTSVDGSASFSGGGALSIVGSATSFTSTGLSFSAGGVYNPEFTSGSHGLISVPGTVELQGGTLRPSFDGYSPNGTESWTLIDASTINGSFTIDQTAAPAGRRFVTSVAGGGTNGQELELGLQALAVLTVNVDDGSASLTSPSGDPIEIIGYSIGSDGGNLSPGGWSSFEDQSTPGWREAGTPTESLLDELAGPFNANTQGSATLTDSATGLGNPLATGSADFQSPASTSDLTFEYVTSDFELVQGQVEYTGLNLVNNLLLTIDPDTGQAELKNSSTTTISLRGYSILSGSSSLQPNNGDWNSLQDQGETGVVEADPRADQLSELVALSENAIVLAPGAAFQLGELFNTAGSPDLSLEFVRQEASAVGDYNNDGVVNIADYTVWRDNLGGGGAALANRDPGNVGVVSTDDYQSWKSNFGGAGSGDGALTILDGSVIYDSLPAPLSASARIPEPTSSFLLVTLLGGALVLSRTSRK